MSQFEEDGQSLFVESAARGLRVLIRAQKELERQERVAVHKAWRCHWRTKLAGKLRRLANKIELSEPEKETK